MICFSARATGDNADGGIGDADGGIPATCPPRTLRHKFTLPSQLVERGVTYSARCTFALSEPASAAFMSCTHQPTVSITALTVLRHDHCLSPHVVTCLPATGLALSDCSLLSEDSARSLSA